MSAESKEKAPAGKTLRPWELCQAGRPGRDCPSKGGTAKDPGKKAWEEEKKPCDVWTLDWTLGF